MTDRIAEAAKALSNIIDHYCRTAQLKGGEAVQMFLPELLAYAHRYPTAPASALPARLGMMHLALDDHNRRESEDTGEKPAGPDAWTGAKRSNPDKQKSSLLQSWETMDVSEQGLYNIIRDFSRVI